MSSRPASPREWIRVAAAWSAIALVAWQAVDKSLDVRTELQKPLDRHLRVLRETPVELVRLKLGEDFEVWRALRERLPRDANVLVSFSDVRADYRELRRRITWLGALSYPIVLLGWPLDPEKPESQSTGNRTRQEYVLDLESGRNYSGFAQCEELARGANFRLLLVGNEAP